MNIVFDLDDTLANSHHRVKKYMYDGKAMIPENRLDRIDWEGFFRECHLDTSISQTCELFRFYQGRGDSVRIWTGRSEIVRTETIEWLNHRNLCPEEMRMRPEKYRVNDDKLKEQWLFEAKDTGFWPDLVFEDRQRVVDMYRSHGIRVFQVAPGKF